MIHNSEKYKLCLSCNNCNGVWVFLWKDIHKEWGNKQGSKNYFLFSDSATNGMIYCSCLMVTSYYSMYKEQYCVYGSKDTGFISLSFF